MAPSLVDTNIMILRQLELDIVSKLYFYSGHFLAGNKIVPLMESSGGARCQILSHGQLRKYTWTMNAFSTSLNINMLN